MGDSSTTYEVILRPAAQRALRHADRPIQRRLVNALTALETDSRPQGVKALRGQRGLLRIRVGDYRIVYEVRDRELVVYVVNMGHRSKIYELLSRRSPHMGSAASTLGAARSEQHATRT